jgi:hypothetical protein
MDSGAPDRNPPDYGIFSIDIFLDINVQSLLSNYTCYFEHYNINQDHLLL